MRLAHNNMKRIAAVLVLAAASTSAFAQSADYRRGYDDGYAAGQRDARDGGRGNHGRGNLNIEEATYGVRGAMCDARRAVRQEAERNGGLVVAGNHLCGDPKRNTNKQLSVVYRCGNDRPVQVSARENDTLRLSCWR